MAFKIVLTKQAEKDLDGIDGTVARRILQKLRWLEDQEAPLRFAQPMREPASGDFRYRIGDYRVIGIAENGGKRIVIVRIGHRSEVYRGK